MARKPTRAAGLVAAAEQVVRETRDARELRQAQSVLLPAALGLSLEATGRLIGRSRATVMRLRAQFQRDVEQPRGERLQWGGRHRQNMTPEEERAFLAPFFAQATTGGGLEVAPVKAAYEQAIGRRVPGSTVYRLLARHGWRKVAPGRRRSRRDPAARGRWESNSRKR